MKKPYIKPQIAFESFQLSTSIAASCALLGTNSAQYVCPVEDPDSGFMLFAEDITSPCDTAPMGGNDSICYDVPLENWNVFSS